MGCFNLRCLVFDISCRLKQQWCESSLCPLSSTAEADRRWFLRPGSEPAAGRPEGDRGEPAVRGPDWGHGRRGCLHLRRTHGGVRGNPERTAEEGRSCWLICWRWREREEMFVWAAETQKSYRTENKRGAFASCRLLCWEKMAAWMF